MKPDVQTAAEPAPQAGEPLISVRDLEVHFALRTNAVSRLLGGSSGTVKAVDGVSFDLAPGEVLGLVGESGSGKSTLGRALLGLVRPSAGRISYRGQEISSLPERRLRPLRRKLQMVFQDPHASLNPSMTVGRAIADALRIHGLYSARAGSSGTSERDRMVNEVLERVGLAPASRFAEKYPNELSGGQKQRAVIARAISLGPELMVADEPISMLDMSVRAKILGLLDDLRRDFHLTFVYITHDLASARFFCTRVAIMYLGRIVEIGPTEQIFDSPRHPYTKALLRAVPDPDPSRGAPRDLPRGEVPDAARPPHGCSFHPRCPDAFAPCGWEARDVRMLFEQRSTAVPAQQYAAEAAIVGPPEAIRAPTPTSARLRPAKGSAEQELELLEAERSTRPDEPMWKGVESIGASPAEVEMVFRPSSDPRLLPVAGASVSVACHLHNDWRTGVPVDSRSAEAAGTAQ